MVVACTIKLTSDFKQFLSPSLSKFVPRGSVRISRSVVGSELECVAFLSPQKQVVVVVMNRGDDPITFKLLDVVPARQGQALKLSALPHSIQTFIYM